ncbi:hypothetical protein CRE_15181 [Caenorhabditis remanei]|uniref:DUF7154 domain-containing protein n=1 Tax=Caenorhabditis remanei TaxID=31234 RepID=E3NPM1_CAERE|nr:hypothetical protein CRE_15181 [Caenorhabditis remanei]
MINRNNTVLYAYSTDIDYFTYNEGTGNMINYAYKYSTTANVRFDTKQEEEIEYHTDKQSLSDSLDSHQPDPSLGYRNKTTGSNLYNVLKKFLNNGKVSLCGAQVFIAVKRYPDESDVSDIISQLRANHVMVYIAVDSVPSGGTNSAILYEVSYQTNGYCAFATGDDLPWPANKIWKILVETSVFHSITQTIKLNILGGDSHCILFLSNNLQGFYWMTAVLQSPYQFLAQNFVVSGSGRIEIPAFNTPIPVGFEKLSQIAVTIQNHTLDSSFVSLNYTIEKPNGYYVYKYTSANYRHYGTEQTSSLWLNGSLSYKWTIDYHYNTDAPQIIECRMYSH